MSEWSHNALRRSLERQGLKRERDAKALQDREVMTDKGGYLWSELLTLMRKRCLEFNAEPEQRGSLAFNESSSVVVISSQFGSGRIRGTYNNDQFRFKGENGIDDFDAVWSLKLTTNSLNVYLVDPKHQPVLLDAIADEVIDTVLSACGR